MGDENENGVRPGSVAELEALLLHDAYNEQLGRIRSPYVYRGLSSYKYNLATSLMRLGGDYVSLERHLLRNFHKYAHRSFTEQGSYWQWLTVAQHHGLPTRLLDWTYSPFVALHFATANTLHFDRDGAIWMVNYHRISDSLPQTMQNALLREGGNVFTERLLSQLAPDLTAFDLLSKTDFTVFFEPPSLDERIVNQFALFSVISNPDRTLDDWLRERKHLYRKIVVPAELKWEIRDKLDQANITERVLFPGLDGLSRWLRRHYCPKSPNVTRPPEE